MPFAASADPRTLPSVYGHDLVNIQYVHLATHHEDVCSRTIPSVDKLCLRNRLRDNLEGFALLLLVVFRWVLLNLSFARCDRVRLVNVYGRILSLPV